MIIPPGTIADPFRPLNGPEQLKAGSFDANKVRAINLLMDEGKDRVDLTGLGKLNEGLVSFQGMGTTEVRYIDPAGRSVVDRWQRIDVGHSDKYEARCRKCFVPHADAPTPP